MANDLAWTVTGFLWKVSLQAGALAAIVWVITRLAPKAPASWRYALWLLVVVKLLVPPFAQYPHSLAFWQPARQMLTAPPAPSPTPMLVDQAAQPSSIERIPAPVSEFQPPTSMPERSPVIPPESALALLWLAGVVVMAVGVGVKIRRQAGLLRQSEPADRDLQQLLLDAARRLQVTRAPEIRMCPSARTPMLIGTLRPVVLLPVAIESSCTTSDLAAMLLHELAHVRRRDVPVMWLQQFAQVFFYFHPAVWLAGREMKRERELACDELVLSRSAIAAEDYAAGYISALKLANGVPACSTSLAMAEPFDLEKNRLKGILANRRPRLSFYLLAGLIAIAAIGLPTFARLTQQTPHQAAKHHPGAAAEAPTSDDLQRLGALGGLTEVTGPGLLITLRDSPKLDPQETRKDVAEQHKIHDTDIREIVDALLCAGAKAVSVGGERIAQNAWIRWDGMLIEVNGMDMETPVEVRAIGDANALKAAIERAGTPEYGLVLLDMVVVKPQSFVRVPGYQVRQPFNRAVPADPAWIAPDGRPYAGFRNGALKGPGIELTLRDSPKLNASQTRKELIEQYRVHDSDIRTLINELFRAGADAISVGGQRVTADTPIQAMGNVVLVKGRRLSPPISIKGIGIPDTLKKTVEQKGGAAEALNLLDMLVVKEVGSVTVPAMESFSKSASGGRGVSKTPAPAVSNRALAQFVNACTSGQIRFVREALARANRSAFLSGRYKGRTALHYAIEWGHPDIARLLIDKGASPNATTTGGSTLLMSAAGEGSIDIAKLLISKGAAVNAKNNVGQTALLWATLQGHLDMVKLLINHHADVRATLENGEQILHVAAMFGRAEIARYLISKGANINARNKQGRTPLDLALKEQARMPSVKRFEDVAEVLRSHRGVSRSRS